MVAPRRRGLFSAHPAVKVGVIVIAVLWSLPTVGLLISSFRDPNEVLASGWWNVFLHPFEDAQMTLINYSNVLTSEGLGAAFVNSLMVTIPSTILPITVAAFAAYALAWMNFPGRTVLFAMIVGLLVLPLQMTLVPLLRLYTDLDLTG
jgi:alpha-glucoside transport system permease protein